MASAQTLGIQQRVVRKTSCRAVLCILWWRLWHEAFCVIFWPKTCLTSLHWRLFSAGFLCVLRSSEGAFLLSGSPVLMVFLFMRWDILCWCIFCCSGGRNWISCMFLGLQFEESQDRVQVLGKWFLSTGSSLHEACGQTGWVFCIQAIRTKESGQTGWVFWHTGN